MQKEPVTTENRSGAGRKILGIVLIILAIPAALLISWKIGDRQFYLTSVIVMIIAMIPFFLSFESRKPSARELVTLAVMTAIAVISRAAFIMLPNVKPMVGIIMITGIALGPEAGFLTGAIGAFVSNFIFGQGPWTPWQMFAYGLAGFIAGLLAKKGIMSAEKKIQTAIIGAVMIFVLIGPLLDTSTVFLMSTMYEPGSSILAIYAAGVPVNAIHAVVTGLTLLILCKPISDKLERIKVKYGFLNK